MKPGWKKRVLGLVAALPAVAAAQTVPLPAEMWQQPRSGRVILSQPAIRQCVQNMLDTPGAVLVIHHGGGDQAQMAAAELRYWLIALALEGGRVELAGDLAPNQPISIEVKEGK